MAMTPFILTSLITRSFIVLPAPPKLKRKLIRVCSARTDFKFRTFHLGASGGAKMVQSPRGYEDSNVVLLFDTNTQGNGQPGCILKGGLLLSSPREVVHDYRCGRPVACDLEQRNRTFKTAKVPLQRTKIISDKFLTL